MVLKQYAVLLAGLVLMGACRSSQNMSAGNSKKDANAGSGICNLQVAAGNPVVEWKKETRNVLKDATLTLPAEYDVYSIDSASLKAFFTAANHSKEDSKAEIIVPLPPQVGCRVFSVFEAGTMSDELKKKFPNIVTLKGMGKSLPLMDIRLEYNGRMMQGQVTKDGETYFIKPATGGNKLYYLVYAKSDVLQPKQDFEKKTDNANADKTKNDNKPVILKYDR